MKVKELIERLEKFDLDSEVVISEADGDLMQYQKVEVLTPKQIIFSEKPYCALGKVWWNGIELGDPLRTQPNPKDEKRADECVLLDF